ncbi:hypothetical protein ACVH9Z_38775 [Rhodococcus opacus]
MADALRQPADPSSSIVAGHWHEHTAGATPVSAGQMTYDLRRVKTRSLIVRIEGTHRYQVTDFGLDTAKFLTCVHDRVYAPGLAELATPPTTPVPLHSVATASPHHRR